MWATVARQVARNISQCISAFKDQLFNSPLHLQWTRSRGTRFIANLVVRVKTATRFWRQNELTWEPYAIAHAHRVHVEKLVLVVVVVVGCEGPYFLPECGENFSSRVAAHAPTKYQSNSTAGGGAERCSPRFRPGGRFWSQVSDTCRQGGREMSAPRPYVTEHFRPLSAINTW